MVIESAEGWFRPLHSSAGLALVHVDLQPHAGRETRAAGLLDTAERVRSDRYRFDRPRREFVLCRAVLRLLLCRRIGCGNGQLRLSAGPYGKLYAMVDDAVASVQFNVSHSGRHGLIAFTRDARVGVDVEDRARKCNIDGVIDSVFGPGEREDLAAAHGRRRHESFLRLWTLKEALIKACGRGFSLDPSGFELPGEIQQGAKTSTFRFPSRPRSLWRLVDLSCDEYAAAVAYEVCPRSAGSVTAWTSRF